MQSFLKPRRCGGVMQVEIIIFANSVKHGQHCVAGKNIHDGKWFRPVSNELGAELSHEQVQYENPYGVFGVKTLQKIRMRFSKHVPLAHQPENYLIDGGRWQQNFSIDASDVSNHLDNPQSLWGAGNRLSYAQINGGGISIEQSLYLVKVEGLSLYYTQDNKRRASFQYKGIDYDLAVTDPKFDGIQSGSEEINGVLCVSLGENYNDFCYKLVAAIF